MTKDTTPRAGIYARVSTDEQVEGTSLKTQLERCRAYLTAHGWRAAGEYVDEGQSGAKSSRPQLDRLMGDVRSGLLERVVVFKLDRFGRSVRHLSNLIGELEDLGAEFVSVVENIDGSTAGGKLQRTILAAFAEFERERISDRTVDGLAAVARDGHWPGGPAPFGWRIERVGRHSTLVLDETEAAVVRYLVEMVAVKGMSTREAAKAANIEGFQTRSGRRWSMKSVRSVLSSPCLSGKFVYRQPDNPRVAGGEFKSRFGPPIPLEFPALVTPIEHEQIRAALADTAHGAVTKKNPYLLSGVITSPCGSPMLGNTVNGGLRRYRCKNMLTRSGTGADPCGCRTVAADVAESAVWEKLVDVLADRDSLMAMAESTLAEADAGLLADSGDLAALDRRIARLERSAGGQVATLLAQGMDAAVVALATSELSRELAEAKAYRSKLAAWTTSNKEARSRRKRLWELAADIERLLANPDYETRRQVVELLRLRVTVQGWRVCPECSGSGVVSMPPVERRARTSPLRGCPGCLRVRWVPMLRIDGEVPTGAQSETGRPPVEALPFRIAEAG